MIVILNIEIGNDIMMANVTIEMDNSIFNDFLRTNKLKIDSIVPKNLSISKDSEWCTEDFWDEENKDK